MDILNFRFLFPVILIPSDGRLKSIIVHPFKVLLIRIIKVLLLKVLLLSFV